MSDEPLSLALKALEQKERTVAEMGSWLRARGVEPNEVEDVVGRLICDGALDDTRYAQRYAEDKRQIKRWGNGRIRAALLDRGISAEDAEQALGEADGGQEIERALELLGDRGAALTDALERQRALALLVRRGYDSEVAYEAIRQARHA
jgi:regulatory protein